MNTTTFKTTKRSKSFEQMGSLEIVWNLVKRHQMFLIVCLVVIENTYILVSNIS